ncbi:two-component sensor histidine kinase [Cellulomonas soli]|uniref:histidine kinase n=1 Tax=Cellulomonas soli TaxID=931535 RepID=A0A512PGH0_9CELL|nr:two-component sensor histidine kinase [Cellulomonas soli]
MPFTVLYVIALLTLLLPAIAVPDPGLVAIGAVLVGLETAAAFALPWRRWPDWTLYVPPLVQMLAVGFLRVGTGGPASPFALIMVLPVVDLAARRGRRGVAVAAIGAAGIIAIPLVLGTTDTMITTILVVRAVFVPLVVLVVAYTVNGLTERLRARTETLATLRRMQDALLERMRADAVELARVAADRRASRDMLLSVFDAVTEQAIIAADEDGLVDVFNPGAEKLLGYARADVVGLMRLTDLHLRAELVARRAELFHEDGEVDNPRFLLEALVAPALAGRPEVRDWTYVRRDGSPITVRLAVTRRADTDPRSAGYVVVAADVTAERETDRLKERFVSLVSHELRTPIASVLGYVELLRDESDPLTAEQVGYLDVIERNARHQLRLVGDLLLTAQVRAGRFAVQRARIDLGDVVRASVQTAVPAAQAAGVELEAHTDPVVMIDGDAGRLAQAVDNLLSNAIKFTPSGGTVTVAVRRARGPIGQQQAEVQVTDTGIGIPPDEVTHLTEDFYRASTATRRALPGFGLGLAITHAIVTGHGGRLEVTSRVDEGTTFTMVLPAVTGSVRTSAPS